MPDWAYFIAGSGLLGFLFLISAVRGGLADISVVLREIVAIEKRRETGEMSDRARYRSERREWQTRAEAMRDVRDSLGG
jgi:hypothetical protein